MRTMNRYSKTIALGHTFPLPSPVPACDNHQHRLAVYRVITELSETDMLASDFCRECHRDFRAEIDSSVIPVCELCQAETPDIQPVDVLCDGVIISMAACPDCRLKQLTEPLLYEEVDDDDHEDTCEP